MRCKTPIHNSNCCLGCSSYSFVIFICIFSPGVAVIFGCAYLRTSSLDLSVSTPGGKVGEMPMAPKILHCFLLCTSRIVKDYRLI